MRARMIVTTIVVGGFALALGAIALAGKPTQPVDTSKYPDLRTVVPDHLNLVNQQQNEYLRFSNGSQFLCGTQPKPNDPCYTILYEQAVSIFEFHPTHNHWHTADVARFEVRKGSPTGTVVGGNSIKVGFCLLDLYNLTENAPTSGKTFWDCYTSYQGISVGWVDQYHQATDGQQVDLTGLANATDYYLVSTTNPTGAFLEQDKTNNTAWVKFTLSTDSNGNRKVTLTDHSPCESPGMCAEVSPNR